MATALETAQSRLASYLAAEASILSGGQETGVASRRRKDAELAEVRRAISDLQAEIASLEASASGGSRLIEVVPK
jgi:hypothetical protein